MGYSTDFSGTLNVTPPLNQAERDFLADFANTRHTSPEGLLFVTQPEGFYVSGNEPQGGKPGIWCHWVAGEDGNLTWDEEEKTYNHAEWLDWIITDLFGPDSRDFVQQRLSEDPRLQHFTHDHIVNGIIEASGEDSGDLWRIKVTNNNVQIQNAEITYPETSSIRQASNRLSNLLET
ncbi:hypothetical protein [Psychromicrobium sp. YIM B11713]|uniref:hypothetical protein n=1 Tax=Psychromicrobium sp. YIM B11713 TaxID=3145233 RepID=UPI00374F9BE5